MLKSKLPGAKFLSTPSARRATRQRGRPCPVQPISIHALREEGDTTTRYPIHTSVNFYPRPPRGGRPSAPPSSTKARIFLSTPSARRATSRASCKRPLTTHFYPRPPRGGRRVDGVADDVFNDFYPRPPRGGRPSCAASFHLPGKNFYPRPPRGGRPLNSRNSTVPFVFLSTPSARRATAKTETKSLFSNKLYNILHEFRRALIYNGSKSYPNHAK